MIEIKYLPEFDEWFDSIKDVKTKARLNARLKKVSFGIMGDVEPVGDKVFEMREHFGAGWRMYYIKHDNIVIVMLGGGRKSKQQRDIDKAIELSKTIED